MAKTDKQIDDEARLAHPGRKRKRTPDFQQGFDAGWAAKKKVEEPAYDAGFEDGLREAGIMG
jgi:hypothetical protein